MRILQVHKPIGTTLILALISNVIFLFVLEAFSRTDRVRELLPEPIVGTSRLELDLSINRLDQYIEKTGSVDCVFVGSSMVRSGINPGIFSPAFKNRTGIDINAFVMGIGDLTPPETEKAIVPLLRNRYQVPLIVLENAPGLLFRWSGFNSKMEFLIQSPFIRLQRGEFNMTGWFIDHFLCFRYFLRFRIWLMENDPIRRALTIQRQLKANGYDPRQGKTPFDPKKIKIKKQLKINFSRPFWEGHLDALDRTLTAQECIVLLELPTHPASSIYKSDDRISDYLSVINRIASIRRSHKTPCITSRDILSFPDSSWLNLTHLNPEGAHQFSLWVAHQLAELYLSGRIRLCGLQ
ncbi:hypothetical protein ACFL27_04460 [candidate division CSSED10-310 bacterium]|uniref:SGNH/GDSL hydrolase family protein n=1 Tax=candidate division CSSED10-310 bacterium TaxID=2855610 RepID=A0ABV6YTB1_UNCC1